MEEALCLAFDEVPSNLLKVYWKVTREDIKVKLRLYLGQRHALILQDYQSMALVASNALGGGSKVQDEEDAPQTWAEAQMAFQSVFG